MINWRLILLQLHFNYLKSKTADMSDNISCLYLWIVYDWADRHVSVSMEEGFHTECDVSTTTGLESGGKAEEVFISCCSHLCH